MVASSSKPSTSMPSRSMSVKPERPVDGGHAGFFRPGFHGLEQGGGYLRIVNEIQPAEAHVALPPFLDVGMVEDGCHPADDGSIPVRQPVTCLAGFEGGVFVPAQCVQIVGDKVRNPIRVIRGRA